MPAARLSGMQQGLQRVKDLVLKLRTFSRLDEGEYKAIDVHESIDAALTFLHHKIKGRIQIDKKYGRRSMLSCYAGEFNQVVLNMLANAVDAIHDKGTITITTRNQNGHYMISRGATGRVGVWALMKVVLLAGLESQ